MIPNPSDIKIQHDSCNDALTYNNNPQASFAQQGNARIYAKTGHWSDDQKLRYLIFIDYHEHRLRLRQNRRQWRIFRAMSAFIKTRKPNQCRSHHSKMQSYFEDIAAIINYFKDRIPNYHSHYQQSLPQLEQIKLGLRNTTSMDYNQEESISNNESLNKIVPVKTAKRAIASRTSIRLAEDEGGLDFKDKNLPKTDTSLNNIPQTNPSPNRSHLDLCALGSEEFLQYAASNYFQLPHFGLISFHNLQQNSNQMSNFFEYYQQRSTSLSQLNEWIECERLYLLWRNSVERLANH